MSVLSGAPKQISKQFKKRNLSEENTELRLKLLEYDRLKFDLRELEAENERLRSLLDFEVTLSKTLRKVIPAQVIGRSPAGWRDSIVVNKGSKQGIRANMMVLSNAGLVGKVSEVFADSAKVKLITHPQFRMGGLVQRSRHTGLIYGTIDGECRIKYLTMDADIETGDLVETAGFSEHFPKGILIGGIQEIWKEPGQIYKVAKIELAADLDRLEEVAVVAP